MILDPKGIEVSTLFNSAEFGAARVLEIGCGDGRLTFGYASAPSFVVGIEPTAGLLTTATNACPGKLRGHVCFVQATAPVLPFPDDSFDIVLFAKSL